MLAIDIFRDDSPLAPGKVLNYMDRFNMIYQTQIDGKYNAFH